MRQKSMFWMLAILFLATAFPVHSLAWGKVRPKVVPIQKSDIFTPFYQGNEKGSTFCILQNDDEIPYAIGINFDSGMGLTTYLDPEMCSTQPIYPFKITNVHFFLYHHSEHWTWPVNIQVRIKNAILADNCLGPDTLTTLYSQSFTIPIDSSYDNIAGRPMKLTLNPPFCLHQPFFLEIIYLTHPAANDTLPAMILDESLATEDSCINWGLDGGIYYRWSAFWMGPVPGDVFLRASGYTHDLECDSCGDVNADGVKNVGDIVYLINYLFKDGPAPNPLGIGDVNLDGVVNVGDVVYLINYLFKNGPSPCS